MNRFELYDDVIEADKVGYVLLFEFLFVEEHLERFLTLPLDTILLAEDGEAFLIDGYSINIKVSTLDPLIKSQLLYQLINISPSAVRERTALKCAKG